MKEKEEKTKRDEKDEGDDELSITYAKWVPSSVWPVVGILLASGLLLAILTLYFQKGLTILGTAISGGAIMSATLDYFIEKFLMVHWFGDRLKVVESDRPCWFSWMILGVWPFMVVVGSLTQWRITGRGIYHQQLVPSKKNRSVNLQRLRSREARAELRQKKYRYLYQVRTAHGDIISQPGIAVSALVSLPLVGVGGGGGTNWCCFIVRARQQALQAFFCLCTTVSDVRPGQARLALLTCHSQSCANNGSSQSVLAYNPSLMRQAESGVCVGQEYIQSLQRKAYPTGDNGTLQSDSTHTTMLPPDHTQLAPLTESEDEAGSSQPPPSPPDAPRLTRVTMH
ncbi:Transmembrane protein 198 [Portunus trituberculatus]|uniref:Transmembrane protein 198 n=1 Tax=Portunus trituberculatus TaxID=210409 RepID=A0A5B7E9Y7_PORTR|nr:Transmembrane protein 198 [Portunus trituberculatus]